MPDLIQRGYSKADPGVAPSSISIAYGISKFVMVTVSDRSNAFLNAAKKPDKKYTIDGLHLNAEGYKVWKDILTKGHYLEN